jgi:hypothetical protein
VRPRDPGGGVGSPFGGHAVVLIARCGHCAGVASFRVCGACAGYPTLPRKVCKVLKIIGLALYFVGCFCVKS